MKVIVRMGKRKLGLALGSGGLRGAAHIGVLRSLERHGLLPDCLSGSSAGAVVAALYAAGYTVSEMIDLALGLTADKIYDPHITWRSLSALARHWLCRRLSLKPPTSWPFPKGLLQGEAWERYLVSLLGDQQFRDLKLPLAILAVDVDNGQSVAFASAALSQADVTLTGATVAQAVRASTSIPGVFVPLHLFGFTLVDGAVKASVPAHLARNLGADVVLAVDLGVVRGGVEQVENIVEVISQSLHIMEAELTSYQLDQHANLVVRPSVYNASLRDFERIPEIIASGEKAMEALIPQLKQHLGLE